jgi:hypothetical protein
MRKIALLLGTSVFCLFLLVGFVPTAAYFYQAPQSSTVAPLARPTTLTCSPAVAMAGSSVMCQVVIDGHGVNRANFTFTDPNNVKTVYTLTKESTPCAPGHTCFNDTVVPTVAGMWSVQATVYRLDTDNGRITIQGTAMTTFSVEQHITPEFPIGTALAVLAPLAALAGYVRFGRKSISG